MKVNYSKSVFFCLEIDHKIVCGCIVNAEFWGTRSRKDEML